MKKVTKREIIKTLLEACKARVDEWHANSHNFKRAEPPSLKLARIAIVKTEGIRKNYVL